jgi:dTDP-4-dehydrorhamnose reductase
VSAGPVIVVGALGMLGRAWRELLQQKNIAHTGLDLPELDITDPDSITKNIPAGCKTIVNCAAYTDVDRAEQDEETALRLNAQAVKHLADRCKSIDATLIHYSTDYVFNGRAKSPYPTDHPRDPINAYGRTKAKGEELIESSGCRHLLIRTSWLYAPWANNFVRTMLKLTAERDTLQVVDDQFGRPASAQHLASASLSLLEHNARGAFHVTDAGECSWHGFTVEIARLAGNTCDIRPCDSAQFPRPAARPAYSVLDISRAEAIIGPMPDWKTNLASVVKQMEPQRA